MGEETNLSTLSLSAIAIGSLPHSDAQSATDLIWNNFEDVPFWPQLSKVDAREDMIIQFTQNIPGMVVNNEEKTFYFDSESEDFYAELEDFYTDYSDIVELGNIEKLANYGIKDNYSSSIDLFLSKVRENKPKYAKGQITGPFTWGTSITDINKKCIFYDETYKDILIKALALKALWQINKIKEASPETTPIIFLDEPTMSQFGTSAFITVQKEDVQNAFKEIINIIKQNGALVGVHCCGKADWDLILDCNPDIINFDTFAFSKSITAYADKISNFIKNNGFIAWGIVPTLDSEALSKSNAESLTNKLEDSIDLICRKGLDKEKLLMHSIITPSCGAGGLNIELATKAMEIVNVISKNMKNKYGEI